MVSLLSYLLTIALSLTGLAVLPVLAAPLPQEVVATSTVVVTSVVPAATATSPVVSFGELKVPSEGETYSDFLVDPVKDVDSQPGVRKRSPESEQSLGDVGMSH